MKPSEIKTRIDELQSRPAVAQLREAQERCAPILERIEELRQEKAAIINAYGAKIRAIRQSGKLSEADFLAFRQAVYAEADEDKRMDMIGQKTTELGL